MSDSLSTRQQQQLLVLSGTGPSSESLDLEDAVIVEIISRLPPKSLLRFRCVCKAWRALISDPYFIREHLTRVNNSYSYSVLVKEISTFRSIGSEALFKDDGPVPSSELYFPVIDYLKFADIQIVGSCNGLICLLFGWFSSVIMLWNPCTRESKVLPKPPLEDRSLFYPFYGFGYDSTTDDYKVIVGNLRHTSGANFEGDILVYTASTGSWRKLQRLNQTFKLLWHGCLVKGALYWVEHEWDEDGKVVIASKLLSFDLAEEKFHEIASPYHPNVPIDLCFHLVAIEGEFRNSLASYSKRPGLEFMMWVMKEAGVEKSWNEVIKISKEVLPVPGDHHRISWKPLCNSNDSVTLIEVYDVDVPGDKSFLTLYNPKENRCRNVTEACVSEAITYVETLVSPFTSTGM